MLKVQGPWFSCFDRATQGDLKVIEGFLVFFCCTMPWVLAVSKSDFHPSVETLYTFQMNCLWVLVGIHVALFILLVCVISLTSQRLNFELFWGYKFLLTIYEQGTGRKSSGFFPG